MKNTNLTNIYIVNAVSHNGETRAIQAFYSREQAEAHLAQLEDQLEDRAAIQKCRACYELCSYKDAKSEIQAIEQRCSNACFSIKKIGDGDYISCANSLRGLDNVYYYLIDSTTLV